MMSLVLLSGFAFTTNTLYAQSYYKWIDARGSTHYTKTPPPKGAKKQGKVDTYSSTSSTSAATSSPASTPAIAPAISSESSKRDITDRSNPTMKTPARTPSSSTF
ncbi:DUF4124 domain-containing protein [uncultured Acinetobacter sp.]|uniref:DUF4124 domain-containing protein n=1 Tax=uncultured Acinetobacter sp. TaxID=165433 RepID=UPI00258D4C9C|nr:DUF4124 domain-containing protein [uncultured Acinetobacter sp.]